MIAGKNFAIFITSSHYEIYHESEVDYDLWLDECLGRCTKSRCLGVKQPTPHPANYVGFSTYYTAGMARSFDVAPSQVDLFDVIAASSRWTSDAAYQLQALLGEHRYQGWEGAHLLSAAQWSKTMLQSVPSWLETSHDPVTVKYVT